MNTKNIVISLIGLYVGYKVYEYMTVENRKLDYSNLKGVKNESLNRLIELKKEVDSRPPYGIGGKVGRFYI